MDNTNTEEFAYIRDLLSAVHPVEESGINELIASLQTVQLKKNDYLLHEGEIQQHIYFVAKGVQMSFYENEDKLHVVAFTYAPGICAVPDSYYFQRPSRYSIRCLSDAHFHRITHDEMERLLQKYHQLETCFRKMTEFILAGMIERQIELRTTSIEDRFKLFAQRSPHLLQLVPHKYLASYLHIDPTNFSKLFNSVTW